MDISNIELKQFFEEICTKSDDGQLSHLVKKKGVVYHQGDESSSFAFILEGKLNIIMHHDDGDFVVTSMGHGEVVGEMGLFLPTKTRTTSVIADEDTKILVVEYSEFLSALDNNYLPLFQMTKTMATRLSATTRHADTIATKGVKERLAALLAEMTKSPLSKDEDGFSVFKMSRKEMSSRIGCSRELAGKYLSQLEDEGRIKCTGMTIKVGDKIWEAC